MGRGVRVTAHLETGDFSRAEETCLGPGDGVGRLGGSTEVGNQRGLKGAMRGAGSQCPHCRHNPGCRTCCGHLRDPAMETPLGVLRETHRSKRGHTSGAGLALQEKHCLHPSAEVWLILT